MSRRQEATWMQGDSAKGFKGAFANGRDFRADGIRD
jgi:hypothetical protein